QQKLVVARELDGDPDLIVAVNPTRGLDFAATALVHDRLRDHRRGGAGILLVSADLDEILALSDRVLVMNGGRLIPASGRRGTTDDIAALMTGVRN
ncbi:MAG: heme ABC transporter ATP-binding protein, partial [Phycisphaerae bacterium]